MGTSDRTSVTIEGKKLNVYTYRPSGDLKGVLFVFHGTDRNADDYRDYAKRLADRRGLYVYAPEFDANRFSTSAYQMGGAASMVDDLVKWGVARRGAGLPVYLFGHSAGAQFLSRVAAYTKQSVNRIIIANPSTWVLPTVEENKPYGFDIKNDNVADANELALMKQYIAAPVTVYLGSEDDVADGNLADGPAAMRQGRNRFERGTNTYNMAVDVSLINNWPLGWRYVVADGVGHSGSRMMSAPEMDEAMA